ncbi:LuxR family transcriptional regulator [Actinoplanes sp. TBRC 11911]|uniref:LuxR family transcriptional regulator n=1 Tax=Actinoplanes sp. TBRC 11911 TaxID=2729386 RepID=UPI001B7D6D4C|nr:LuxR family transcriptional regulator [Actinoplanes sp. TBRC 11911]
MSSLTDLARIQMASARRAERGLSVQIVRGSHNRALRHIVMGLRAAATVCEYPSAKQATLQVLAGRIRVTVGPQTFEAITGDLLAIPTGTHTLVAIEDSALLLTVSLLLGTPDVTAEADGRLLYMWRGDS